MYQKSKLLLLFFKEIN